MNKRGCQSETGSSWHYATLAKQSLLLWCKLSPGLSGLPLPGLRQDTRLPNKLWSPSLPGVSGQPLFRLLGKTQKRVERSSGSGATYPRCKFPSGQSVYEKGPGKIQGMASAA